MKLISDDHISLVDSQATSEISRIASRQFRWSSIQVGCGKKNIKSVAACTCYAESMEGSMTEELS